MLILLSQLYKMFHVKHYANDVMMLKLKVIWTGIILIVQELK